MLKPRTNPKRCATLERRLKAVLFAFTLTIFGAQLAGYSNRAEAADVRIPAAGSCNNAQMGFCNEFTGTSYDAKSSRRMCESQKMQYLPASCPSEGRVGSCLVYKGKKTESNYVYYSSYPGTRLRGGATAASAASKQCAQLKGEWRPH